MTRRGFTVIEMLIAVGLSAAVVAEMSLVIVNLFRVQREKMWNVEFAHQLRVAREYVLFRAKPSEGTDHFGGLLGASNLVWSGSQVVAHLQKSAKTDADTFETDPCNLSYEMGGRFTFKGMDDGRQDLQPDIDGRVTNSVAFLSVEAQLQSNGQRTNRIERIAVPVYADPGEKEPWRPFLRVTKIEWRSP